MSLLDFLDTTDAAASALKDLSNIRLEYTQLPGAISATADHTRRLEHSFQQRPTDRKAAELEVLRKSKPLWNAGALIWRYIYPTSRPAGTD